MSTKDPRTDMDAASASNQALLPCSLAQKRFWFLEQFEPGNPALNIGVRWRMEGAISDTAIESAYQSLLERHEILRTTFTERDGEPFQIVLKAANSKVSVVDLTRLQPQQRTEEAERISARDAQSSIDIRTDIPIRLTSLRLDDRNVMILLSMHHIASDGISMGILAHEFGALVTAAMKNREPALEPLEMQFADFALWQADMVGSGAYKADAQFWTETLKDLPYFEVDGDRERPTSLGTESDFVFRVMSPETSMAFERAAPELGQTLYNISTTALARMLQLWTGAPEIVMGTQVAGRDDVMLEPLVGLFINTIVLRLDLPSGATGRNTIDRVSARIDDAMAHRQFPFEMLVQQLNPPRDPSRTPLFSVNYSLIRPVIRSERFDGVDLVSLPSQPTGAQYDLLFFLVKRIDGWRLTCESSRAIYDFATIERMLALWEQVLGEMVRTPDKILSNFPRPAAVALTPAAATNVIADASKPDPKPAIVDYSADLKAAWQDILRRQDVTVATHFFEAGGHSLLALRLLSRVKALTGQTVPVATLFQNPVLGNFIAAVQATAPKIVQTSQISWLSKTGSKPPVIVLNDGAVYHPIARLLSDRPTIDINVAGDMAPQSAMSKSFEAFGRDALKLVRAAQPHGPYTLMGHCVFGALAFEVAQQLVREGETVSLVAMLDTIAPGYVEEMPGRDRAWRRAVLAKYSVQHFFELVDKVRKGEMSKAGLLFQYGFIRRNGLVRLLERAKLLDKLEEGSDDYAQIVFGNQLLDARRRYRCAPYAGNVTQFRAMTAREGRLFDHGFGWSRILTGRYDVVVVPSDHFNMMREPAATVVAKTLTDHLSSIEAAAARAGAQS